MFFVNSTVNLIYAYDYDLETGTASNRRVFVDGEKQGLTKSLYGSPDGFCIDKEGCIWCARRVWDHEHQKAELFMLVRQMGGKQGDPVDS